MSLLVWVMMGIAVWHFTVFVPDRFWGGIVGAFLAGMLGAALFGFLVNGLSVPGESDTHIVQALIAIPGSLLGLAASYLYGSRVDTHLGVDHGATRAGSG
jgi:uncharacterized membrane protein YeaQ/YmgE (transglycosylase-associated protein family)